MISFNSNVWLDNHHKVAYSINSLGLPSGCRRWQGKEYDGEHAKYYFGLWFGIDDAIAAGFGSGFTIGWENGGLAVAVAGGAAGGGAGSFASYSMTWAYNNYSGGNAISQETDLKNEDVSKPKSAEGKFVPDEMVKEAEQILTDARNSVIANGLDPSEFEAGASFRVRQKFWSGDDYLFVRDEPTVVFIDGENGGVGFRSYEGDHFRMHLHTKAGIAIGHGYTDPYHPSPSVAFRIVGTPDCLLSYF